MLNEKRIKVVVVPASKDAYVLEIDNSIDVISTLVGGKIGIIDTEFKVSENYLNYIYCDMGKMDNYTPSRAIYIRDGKPGDIIFGDFVITRIAEEGYLVSLTDEECSVALSEMSEPTREPWTYIYEMLGMKVV